MMEIRIRGNLASMRATGSEPGVRPLREKAAYGDERKPQIRSQRSSGQGVRGKRQISSLTFVGLRPMSTEQGQVS